MLAYWYLNCEKPLRQKIVAWFLSKTFLVEQTKHCLAILDKNQSSDG